MNHVCRECVLPGRHEECASQSNAANTGVHFKIHHIIILDNSGTLKIGIAHILIMHLVKHGSWVC